MNYILVITSGIGATGTAKRRTREHAAAHGGTRRADAENNDWGAGTGAERNGSGTRRTQHEGGLTGGLGASVET